MTSFLPLQSTSTDSLLQPFQKSKPPTETKLFYFKFRCGDCVRSHLAGKRWDETVYEIEARLGVHKGEDAITEKNLQELLVSNRRFLNVDQYGAGVKNNRYSSGRTKFVGYPACIPEPKDDASLYGFLLKPDYIVPPNAKITLRRVLMGNDEQRQVPASVMRRRLVEQVSNNIAGSKDHDSFEKFADLCATNAFIAAQMPQEERFHKRQRI